MNLVRSKALGLAVITGALALVSLQACKDGGGTSTSEPAPGTTTSPPTKTTEQAAATPPAANTGFGVPLAANQCPCAAPGSTTAVKELPDGVELTVTAPGGTPINDIRQRGVQIVAASKDPAKGAGSAADGLSKCPILIKDMIVTETDVPGGAKFTVKPVQSTALALLKKETKARAAGYTPEK